MHTCGYIVDQDILCSKWVVIKPGTERNGINWGTHYSSFIEQALYFYDFDDITNLGCSIRNISLFSNYS